MADTMASDVTRLLERWHEGDAEALAELMPLVYEELRKLAQAFLRRERPDHTLQPTALVHEAYLRLVGATASDFKNRKHFYGAAAQAMRRILVENARHHGTDKRGQDWTRVSLDDIPSLGFNRSLDLVQLDEALTGLTKAAPRAAAVVELRCFGGLSIDETAAYLEVAPVTIKRQWSFARAWLYRALTS